MGILWKNWEERCKHSLSDSVKIPRFNPTINWTGKNWVTRQKSKTPPKKFRGPRSPNNAKAASAHFPVRSGGSAQTGFQVGLAVQIEFRAARTSLGAYVRLLSTHLHGMLRACAPGHLRPTPRASSHSRPNLKSRFSRWLTLGGHGPRSVAAGQRFEVIFLGAGRKPRYEDTRANSKWIMNFEARRRITMDSIWLRAAITPSAYAKAALVPSASQWRGYGRARKSIQRYTDLGNKWKRKKCCSYFAPHAF